MSSDRTWLPDGIRGRGARGALAGALTFGLVAAAAGCPGSLENKDEFLAAAGGGGGAGPTTSTSGQGAAPGDDPCGGLITDRCAIPGCHVPERTSPDLTLEGRVERIRDVEAATCDGLLVDTANPEASLMYTKCAEPDPECGNQMPLSGPRLDDEDLACILAWIESL